MRTHKRLIRQALEAEVEVLLFPELSLAGYLRGARTLESALPTKSEIFKEISGLAPEMSIAVGFVEEASLGEVYNSMAVLRDGTVQHVYRKINLATYGDLEEGKVFGSGDRVELHELRDGWPCVTMICADLWNPGLVHAAMVKRPALLLAAICSAEGAVDLDFSNPDNWALNLAFYSMTYGTPIVMANQWGREGKRRFWGGSRIMGPRGELLAQAEDGEALIWADLNRHEIALARFRLPTIRDANARPIRNLL